MQRIEVPAMVRTRVAGHAAKGMPMTVSIDVLTEPPDQEAAGLIEVERGWLPFATSERTEQPLGRSQNLAIGAAYASFAVYVTSEKPVTLLVASRGVVRPWVVPVAVAICILAATIVFLVVRG